MDKAFTTALIPSPIRRKAAARAALVGMDPSTCNLLSEGFRQFGIESVIITSDAVERLRKELTRLTTDFESNITKAEAPVKFTRAELDGVSESFLSRSEVKTGDDEFVSPRRPDDL